MLRTGGVCEKSKHLRKGGERGSELTITVREKERQRALHSPLRFTGSKVGVNRDLRRPISSVPSE